MASEYGPTQTQPKSELYERMACVGVLATHTSLSRQMTSGNCLAVDGRLSADHRKQEY